MPLKSYYLLKLIKPFFNCSESVINFIALDILASSANNQLI